MRVRLLLSSLVAVGALGLAACGDESITQPAAEPAAAALGKPASSTVVNFEGDVLPPCMGGTNDQAYGPFLFRQTTIHILNGTVDCGQALGTVAHGGTQYAYLAGGYVHMLITPPVQQITCYVAVNLATRIEARDANGVQLGRAVTVAPKLPLHTNGPTSVAQWTVLSFKTTGNRIAELFMENNGPVYLDDCTLVTKVK